MAKKNTNKVAGCLRCASADDIERQLINYAAGIIGLRKRMKTRPSSRLTDGYKKISFLTVGVAT